MGLADDLNKADSNARNMRCPVVKIMGGLDEEDREALAHHLGNESSEGATIARVMSANGYPVSGQAIQRHRRGACSCVRAS